MSYLLFVDCPLEDGLESSASIVPSWIGAPPSFDEICLEALYSSSKLSLVRLSLSHFIMYMVFLLYSALVLCPLKERHIVCFHGHLVFFF